MRIYIKTRNASSLVLNVESKDKIDDVKIKIQQKLGIPSTQQCLIFKNRITKNWLTLHDYQVEDHSTFNLIMLEPSNINLPIKYAQMNQESNKKPSINEPINQNISNLKPAEDDHKNKQPKVSHKGKNSNIGNSIKCKACNQKIENQLIYFSGYPYHLQCVKCMSCGCTCQSIEDSNNFTCVTPGLFLCKNDYNQYQVSKQLTTENFNEYHKKNKENFVDQIFDDSLQNAVFEESEYSILSPEVVEDSIKKDIPYDKLIPTATFKLDLPPDQIDFEKLKEILGDDVIIIDVEKGCTFLKIAFRSVKKFLGNCAEKIEKSVNKVKNVITTIGKAIVGNLVEEPIIKVPKDEDIQAMYNQSSKNLLQNTYELNEIDIEDIQKEVFSKIENESDKKNWNFLFKHNEIFKEVENKIRDDISNNEFENVLIAQTMIANRHIDELLLRIKKGNFKKIFVYHGTRLEVHQLIVKNEFLMPGQDNIQNKTDDGWFGKGIYATDNMTYASLYCNSYNLLRNKDKAHIICCIAFYDNSNVIDVKNKSQYEGQPIAKNVKEHCGIHRVLVGSSVGFTPIKESNRDKNFLSAHEYVFPNKFQIIPVYSFTIMRKDYFILWKDDHINNEENSNYMKELQKEMEVNVYGVDSIPDALKIIEKKKRNKIKLMTNAGQNLTGKKLIEEARKIIGSNFVCLVFTGTTQHLEWATKMENVLLTTSAKDFRRFSKINMNENDILDFAHDLESEFKCKFNINKNELLNFHASQLYKNDKFYTK